MCRKEAEPGWPRLGCGKAQMFYSHLKPNKRSDSTSITVPCIVNVGSTTTGHCCHSDISRCNCGEKKQTDIKNQFSKQRPVFGV